MPTIHLTIKGKVQGVFYRATAKDVAKENGITGWIKNTPDDNVEALVTGTEEQLQKFVAWCRQGPRSARVIEVIVTESEQMKFTDFTIVRD